MVLFHEHVIVRRLKIPTNRTSTVVTQVGAQHFLRKGQDLIN